VKKSLAEIAALVKGTLQGEANIVITGVTNIEEAAEGDITFAVAPHLDKAEKSQATAIIIPDSAPEFSKPAIRVSNPRAAFAQLLQVFTPPPQVERGIHPTAVIGRGVKLGKNSSVMACAVLAEGAVIGDNAVIYPHVYVGAEAVIGSDTILYPNVTVREKCVVGSRVILHSGAVIGSDGFGFVTVEGKHMKVPHVGIVVIEDDVEIGANTTVDRGTTGSTVVKRGTKIDNLVHLAHNVVVGEDCYLVAQTGIAGSARIGNRVTFAGQSGSAGHLSVGDNCVFAARAAVISDVPAGSFYAGFPARPHKEWLRAEAAVRKLPELMKKLQSMEKRLAAVENQD
jgi:UDP-3-O-[3-hydroxymyristoyl] glucosamine N-acyltransferase